jgi:hypothetical protein
MPLADFIIALSVLHQIIFTKLVGGYNANVWLSNDARKRLLLEHNGLNEKLERCYLIAQILKKAFSCVLQFN